MRERAGNIDDGSLAEPDPPSSVRETMMREEEGRRKCMRMSHLLCLQNFQLKNQRAIRKLML